MKWPKIVLAVLIIVVLYAGVSMAGYIHLYSPAFGIDLKEIAKIASFVVDSQLTAKDIVAVKAPAPVSGQLEHAARMQEVVARGV